jgi:hypothetical protein
MSGGDCLVICLQARRVDWVLTNILCQEVQRIQGRQDETQSSIIAMLRGCDCFR